MVGNGPNEDRLGNAGDFCAGARTVRDPMLSGPDSDTGDSAKSVCGVESTVEVEGVANEQTTPCFSQFRQFGWLSSH